MKLMPILVMNGFLLILSDTIHTPPNTHFYFNLIISILKDLQLILITALSNIGLLQICPGLCTIYIILTIILYLLPLRSNVFGEDTIREPIGTSPLSYTLYNTIAITLKFD
tara:strand:- start:962 stop:1294 length:333 start_codon:yes stop_codon:yes gene_type:complete